MVMAVDDRWCMVIVVCGRWLFDDGVRFMVFE
jgi:hypothetical protein